MSVVERERVEVVTDRERRARVLEAAALEIELRGWCQQTSENVWGNVCAVGALKAAIGVDPGFTFTFADIHRIHGIWGSEDWYLSDDYDIVEFNDCPDTDAQDVTFLIRWRAQEIRDGR